MTICMYFLQISETFYCDKSLKLWLYSRIFFSFILSINIIYFMVKISDTYREESRFFNSAKSIYSKISLYIKNYDFFIRRKSLICLPGILLLFLSIISFFWSYLIISFYHFENYYQNCDIKIQKFLNFHSLAILLGNLPLFFICIVLVIVKVSSYAASYICPEFFFKLSDCCYPENPVK